MRLLSLIAVLALAFTAFGQSLPNEVKSPVGTATVLGPDAGGAVKVIGAAQAGVTLSPGTLTVNGQSVAVVVATGGGGPLPGPGPAPGPDVPPDEDPKLAEFQAAFAKEKPAAKANVKKLAAIYRLLASADKDHGILAKNADGSFANYKDAGELFDLLLKFIVDELGGGKFEFLFKLIAILLREVLPDDPAAGMNDATRAKAAKQFVRIANILERLR